MVKTLPSPSSKYVNPRNLGDVLAYYEARVLSGWNSFVRKQQSLYSLYNSVASGKYSIKVAKQSMRTYRPDAVNVAQGQAIKGLVKSILNGKAPYGLNAGSQQKIVDAYIARDPKEIYQVVSEHSNRVKDKLPDAFGDDLLRESMWARFGG